MRDPWLHAPRSDGACPVPHVGLPLKPNGRYGTRKGPGLSCHQFWLRTSTDPLKRAARVTGAGEAVVVGLRGVLGYTFHDSQRTLHPAQPVPGFRSTKPTLFNPGRVTALTY